MESRSLTPRRVSRRALLLLLGATVAVAAAATLWWRGRPEAVAALPSAPSVAAPAGVRITVEVLNSTGTRGLARLATQHLRDAGFDVVRIATDTARRDTTLVVDRSGHPEWARAVSRALGVTRVESRPDSSRYLDVSVFIGANWRAPAKPFYP